MTHESAPSILHQGFSFPDSWILEWKDRHLTLEAAMCWIAFLTATVLGWTTSTPSEIVQGLFVVSYLFGGSTAAYRALADLRKVKLNIDLLMVLAAIGAAILGAWIEGAILLGLFSASNALQAFALGRTREAVEGLVRLSPQVATVLRPDAPGGRVVPIQEVTTEDTILVIPGERIASDGTISAGSSALDQSTITGESMPVDKVVGDRVFAGTINGQGVLHVRVTAESGQNTIDRVAKIVATAQEERGPTQRLIDAFEGPYALAVIVGSIVATVLPIVFFGETFDDAFYRAMALLVVASPCALVISTPASVLSAISNAARHGILVKGGEYIETLGRIRVVAFDKTGTLTQGRPRVTDIVSFDPRISEQRILSVAASIESFSEHPLARAIVQSAAEMATPMIEATEVQAVPAFGITGRIDSEDAAVGKRDLIEKFGVVVPVAALASAQALMNEAKTVMYVGSRSQFLGLVAVADVLRPQARDAISQLQSLGIRHTVMLTGDNKQVGNAIAQQLKLNDVVAELLPEQKLETIKRLSAIGPVAMIGDGVNDAPALATAAIGVAMGAAGSDVALEVADVVLMSDDLLALPYAVSLGQRTQRIVRQNLTFSLGVIITLITLTLTIGIPLPIGVVGHEGSTVIVILNGLRLLKSPAVTEQNAKATARKILASQNA